MKKYFIFPLILVLTINVLKPLKISADGIGACETEIVTNTQTGEKYCMPESIYNGNDNDRVRYRAFIRTGTLNNEDISWLEQHATNKNNIRIDYLNKNWSGLWEETTNQLKHYYNGVVNGALSRSNATLFKYMIGSVFNDYNTNLYQKEVQGMQETQNKNYYTTSQQINNNQVYNTGSTYYTQLYNYTTNNFYDITNNTYYDVNNWHYDITNNYYTYNIDNSRHYNIVNDYTSTNVFVFNNGNEDSYKMYYRLPDGRNSYNLTEDDIKGYRTDFIIKNYDNIYDYDSLTALYHFDGDIKNSAYGGQNYLNLSKGSNTFNDGAKNFGQALFYTGDFSFNVDDGEVLDYKLMPQVSNKFSLNISDSSDTNKLLKYPSFCFNNNTNLRYDYNNYLKIEIDYNFKNYTSTSSTKKSIITFRSNTNKYLGGVSYEIRNNSARFYIQDDSSNNIAYESVSSTDLTSGKISVEIINNKISWTIGNSSVNFYGDYTYNQTMDFYTLDDTRDYIRYSKYIISNENNEFINFIALYDEEQNRTYLHNLADNQNYDINITGFGELINYSSGLTFVINKKFDNNVEFYENGYINNSTSYISSDDNAYYLNYNSWNHLLFVKNESKTDLYVNGIKFTTLNSNILDLNFNIKQDGYTMIDELRILNSSQNFIYYGMPNLPYNTNLVYVLPKEVDTNNNILIKSIIPVNNWQIGGVRPSRANIGDVFIYVDDFGYMKSLQQFDGNDWIAVDGALYNQTLKKWVDYNGFSIYLNDFTYQESQDITIYSITDEFSFYQWLQQEINRIISAIESISFNNVINNNNPDSTNFWDFLIALIDELMNGVSDLIDKIIEFIKWLLIPDENFNIDSELELIQTNLGILWLPFNLLGNIFNYLFNSETLSQNHVINFNGFEFMNVRLIPPFTYDFDSLFNTEPFNTMHNIYLSVIDFVCIVYVINLARKKFISFTGGNE